VGQYTRDDIRVAEKRLASEICLVERLSRLNAAGFHARPLIERAVLAFLDAFPERLVVAFLELVVIEPIDVAGENAGVALVLPRSADDTGCLFGRSRRGDFAGIEANEAVGQAAKIDLHDGGEAGPIGLRKRFYRRFGEEMAPVPGILFGIHGARLVADAGSDRRESIEQGFARFDEQATAVIAARLDPEDLIRLAEKTG